MIRALLVQTGRLDFIPLPPAKYGTQTTAGMYQAVDGQPLPTTETPLFGADQVDQAYPSTDSTGGRAVGFRLKSTGSALFGDYTSAHVGEFFAIVLDGRVVSAPVIQSAISGGSGDIAGGSTGGFSANEMDSLITVLNYGSLPFPLKEESSREIGSDMRTVETTTAVTVDSGAWVIAQAIGYSVNPGTPITLNLEDAWVAAPAPGGFARSDAPRNMCSSSTFALSYETKQVVRSR